MGRIFSPTACAIWGRREADFYVDFISACPIYTVFLYGRTYIGYVGVSLSYGDIDMKHTFEQLSGSSGMADPLDGVCLSQRNRDRAHAYLRKADRVTDIVIRAVANIRAAVAWTERGAGELTRRIRAMIRKPAQN